MLTYKIAEKLTKPLMKLITEGAHQFAVFDSDTIRIKDTAQGLVDQEEGVIIVAKDGRKLVGYICGMVHTGCPLTAKVFAQELSLYIREGYRHKPDLLKTLIEGFEYWAEKKGAELISIAAYPNNKMGKIYERYYDYTETETHYVKRIQ